MHSTTSDGALSPSEVVYFARQAGLTTIALTDHETTDGVREAQAAGYELGVEVIAGLEINSGGDHGSMHFLGYFIDPANALLRKKLLSIHDARLRRAKTMVKRLSEIGVALDWERVLEIAGDTASIARPHIALALIDAGYVTSVHEAFDRYIGDAAPAYVNRLRLTPQQAIEMVHEAGGLIILAHPVITTTVESIPMLQDLGLDGIEVYYPEHTPEDIALLERIAVERNLVTTGGSDFHAWDDGVHANLGEIYVPPECVIRLQDAS